MAAYMTSAGLFRQSLGLNRILDDAYRVLGNPIVVIDTSYNLLSCTENTVSDDPLWNELTAVGVFSHETVDSFNSAHFIQAVADADVVSLLKHESLPYDRACGKFFDKDGIQLGSIIVVACYRDFSQDDFEQMEQICDNIAEELQKSSCYHLTERVFHDSFISDLLDGENSGGVLFENSLQDLYTDLKSNLFLLVVDICRYEPTLSHLSYLRDTLAHMQGKFKYFIYLNNIVILASLEKPVLRVKKDLAALHDFFIKYNLFAGVSDCFQNLLEAQAYYKQALAALNRGMAQDSARHIFRYDEFRADCFLDSIKNDTDIWALFNPVLTLIREHDDENGTGYFEVLRVCLLNSMDLTAAARTLGIEEDALRLQLDQVADIFEIDWHNGNLLFSLALSYKILACF
ncbi:MAG: helix-turn-helix domain-containing protein [Clostridiales Family XIII bacterium]|nr:helix-turn-helix domain-containing protein [Clostridiales Family XIII bacterium]